MEHVLAETGRNESMQQGYGRLMHLAASMFRIGAIGFGGGNALIPVIEEEVVRRGRLVSKRDYEEDVVAACVTPGALPVEIAAGIGQRLGGYAGMMLAASMMALPGSILTILILAVLSGGQGEALLGIRSISIGLGAFIISLLLLYVIKTFRQVQTEGQRTVRMMGLVMTAVFLLSSEKNIYALLGVAQKPIFGLSVVATLGLAFFLIVFLSKERTRAKYLLASSLIVSFLLSGSSLTGGLPWMAEIHVGSIFLMGLLGVYGISQSFRGAAQDDAARDKGTLLLGSLKEALVWFGFALFFALPSLLLVPESLSYLMNGFLSSLLSFGGGDAYLTIADGLFVGSGAVTAADFYGQLVPVANALPGSILCKILTGIGYFEGMRAGGMTAGLLLTLSGFGISVAASGLLFGFVARLLRTFHDVPVFRQVSFWVRPIISGLLLNVALSMLRTNLAAGAELSLPQLPVLLLTVLLAVICLLVLCRPKAGLAAPMMFSAGAGFVLMLI
ncbi:chromate transporter [Mitsuokella sp. WILCCON 0060]|uniref:chromate transporter n=1 Tax=unclassified Mitsuokella TaxID=2637239 RepID=UPI003F08BECD